MTMPNGYWVTSDCAAGLRIGTGRAYSDGVSRQDFSTPSAGGHDVDISDA